MMQRRMQPCTFRLPATLTFMTLTQKVIELFRTLSEMFTLLRWPRLKNGLQGLRPLPEIHRRVEILFSQTLCPCQERSRFEL